MTGTDGTPALRCVRVSRSFGATRAVRAVDLEVAPGSVCALLGENGAGKSTLLAMIAGETTPDEGTIEVGGRLLAGSPTDAADAGVAIVHQELSLFANLTVAENLLLGREPRRRFGTVHHGRLREQATAALAALGAEIDPDRPVAALSPSERQLVEVAKAMAVAPRLLILDEPTSSLEPGEVALLRSAVRRLCDAGTAVVFVSHRLSEVFEFSDAITVLRAGELVAHGPVAEFDEEKLINAMVGRKVEQLYPERRDGGSAGDDAPVLELVGAAGGVVARLDLALRPGRIVGISGLEGHGQHDAARLAAGALPLAAGELRLRGEARTLRSSRDAVRAGIAYVPPDRRLLGLFLGLSVRENLSVAAHRELHPAGIVRPRGEAAAITPVAERLRLRYGDLHQPVGELSGGNQQKVLFGRWLMTGRPAVLVLDDPTRGVDVGARAEIYRLLRDLCAEGTAVLLVSTDMLELLGLADEIHVMYEGRVTGTLAGADATEESIMALATGRRL